jgi:hypothetical protein
MTFRPFVLCLAMVAVAGCGGDDAPAAPSDQELEVRRLEAEARLAEARARDGGTSTSSDAAVAAPTDVAAVPAPAASGTAAAPRGTAGGSSGSSSTRPGLTGLPPSANPPALIDGTQEFTFCPTYVRSAVSRYQGMELCYTGTVRQEGNKIVGTGSKDTENGQALRGAARSPFRIEGYIYDDYTVRFNFTDQGERRVSRGSVDLPESGFSEGCTSMGWQTGGTFQTDAANSSGTATMTISRPDCGA